jgi:hypothetical protein
MSDTTINGYPVYRADHKQPYYGAWTAEVEHDANERVTGSATLTLLDRTWVGTVVADPGDSTLALSGDSGGFFRCRIVGGAGGLQKQVEPTEWAQGALVQTVLTAILSAGGEVQSATIDPSLLTKVLPQWSIVQGTVDAALAALCDSLGVIWRTLDDGSIWIGTPNPQPVTAPDYIFTELDPEMGMVELDLNEASIQVDQIIDGLTVKQVIYTWGNSSLRALVTIAPGPVNSLFTLFSKWMSRMKIDNFRQTPGRINSQNIDKTVQFQPDDSRFSPLRRVALRLGLPDTEVTVNASSRAVVGWENASPTAPFLVNFGDSTASSIKLAASQSPRDAARKGDACGYLLVVIANVSGVPVVTQVNWSSVQPVTPFVTPIVPAVPGSYYQKITITEGSNVVEIGG